MYDSGGFFYPLIAAFFVNVYGSFKIRMRLKIDPLIPKLPCLIFYKTYQSVSCTVALLFIGKVQLLKLCAVIKKIKLFVY